MCIIAIAGTHGTGKTTLAYDLCTRFKKGGINSVVLDERARECPFPINEEACDETQIWLIVSHIKKELELINKYEVVVVDRSVLDPYVYGSVVTGDGIYKYLYKYCIEHIQKYYKRLYLLNPEVFDYCIMDGVRSTNKGFRYEVDLNFVSILIASDIEFEYVSDISTVYNDIDNMFNLD